VRRGLVATLAAIAALAVPALAHAQELRGAVNPDATITLRDANGQPVTHLDPGTYTVVVEDRADFHSFHLHGPGVDVATGVEEIVTVTWTVTFVDGVYDFFCDPHSREMFGRFTVGSATLPTPPPPPARLIATVGPGNTISLRTSTGTRVQMLTAGAYVITVRDRSRTHNFRLVGPNVRRATTARFSGTVTWRLTLRAGTYRFSSDSRRSLRGTFHVH